MPDIDTLTPMEIVAELDRYIIGQTKAKRAMSIALRNRWRRQQVAPPLRDEIAPKNILMIGPTGVGKTEIARRLAKMAKAPFIKVEATKFTEVGYVGKDVESIVREITDLAVKMLKEEEQQKVMEKAKELAEERLLDLLLPKKKPLKKKKTEASQETENTLQFVEKILLQDLGSEEKVTDEEVEETQAPDDTSTREKLRDMLRKGKLENRLIDFETNPSTAMPMIEVVAAGGMEDLSANLRDMFSQMMSRGRKRRKLSVSDARTILTQDEAQKLVDMDTVVKMAIERVEQSGIVFLDEVDKICSRQERHGGGEVSREGVQRDLLPIVEGSNVMTKYGMVRTDHVLFVAAGAFHASKPSDLIPELQGRFPIRVELEALTEDDFFRILTEPANSLEKQYTALLETEKFGLSFEKEALRAIAAYSVRINQQTENIGARRLHTVMERVLDTVSFEAPERGGENFAVTAQYVEEQLKSIVADQDLSRYIL